MILTPQACTDHLPIQLAEASQLLYDLLKTPEVRYAARTPQLFLYRPFLFQGFYNHIRRYSSSVILSVLFGTRSPKYEGGRVAQ